MSESKFSMALSHSPDPLTQHYTNSTNHPQQQRLISDEKSRKSQTWGNFEKKSALQSLQNSQNDGNREHNYESTTKKTVIYPQNHLFNPNEPNSVKVEFSKE